MNPLAAMSSISSLVHLFGSAAFARVDCTSADITRFVQNIARDERQFAARFVRGKRMRNEAGVLDEFAAAWQFPWYYGRNWNAFSECISDLHWIAGTDLLCVVLDSDQLLVEAEADALSVFLRLMTRAKGELAQSTEECADIHSRSGRWFRTLLHCDRENIERWEKRFSRFRGDIIEGSIGEVQ
jgi:hypothetical protein